MEHEYLCACCGQTNETTIDISAGDEQEFVEDCRVCCRPNVVRAVYNEYLQKYTLEAYLEDRD